jgi:hypothetical protein
MGNQWGNTKGREREADIKENSNISSPVNRETGMSRGRLWRIWDENPVEDDEDSGF